MAGTTPVTIHEEVVSSSKRIGGSCALSTDEIHTSSGSIEFSIINFLLRLSLSSIYLYFCLYEFGINFLLLLLLSSIHTYVRMDILILL